MLNFKIQYQGSVQMRCKPLWLAQKHICSKCKVASQFLIFHNWPLEEFTKAFLPATEKLKTKVLIFLDQLLSQAVKVTRNSSTRINSLV